MSPPRTRPRSRIVDVAFGLVVAATAGVAAAAALARWSRPLDTVGQFASPALTIAVVAAVLALIARRRAPALMLAGAAVLLAAALAPQWVAGGPSPAAGARPVRIYFNNVYRKNGGAGMGRSIEAADADVVGLLEVSRLNGAAVRQALKAYPYRLESDDEIPWLGRTIVASRYPLRRLVGDPELASTSMFAVEVKAARPFHLFVVHTPRPWPYPAQEWTLGELRKRLADETDTPVVLMGDFNATLSSAALEKFRRQTGYGALATVFGDWPSYAPAPFRLGIENALAGPGLTLFDRRLGRPNGSDHRPLVFEVAPAAPAVR
jgi:endonuclease/exonuclease/phosphatase (EEP) superfamily protein YafD